MGDSTTVTLAAYPVTTSADVASPTILSQIKATGEAQVLVVLKADAPAAAAAVAPTAAAVAPRAFRAAPKAAIGGLEKYFVPSQRSRGVAGAVTASLAVGAPGPKRMARSAGLPLMRYYPALGVVLGTVNSQGLSGLQQDGRVDCVTGAPVLSLIRPVQAVAAGKLPRVGSGADLLNVPALWEAGYRGDGVVIAHLDTGVDASHPVLNGAVGDFAEFDLNGDEVAGAQPHDSGQHGTHTAGIAAGRAFQNTFVGVAPEAKLASALVIEGGDIVARILGGLNWALTKGAKVLSMSLGIRGYHDDFLPLVKLLRSRGMLPVIAVGNEGVGTSRSPGNYAESLSVGACDNDKNVAKFSSSQMFARAIDPLVPDVVGPGVDIISCVPGGGYMSMSGSSMATPAIAGLAALLYQASPGATVDQVENAIFQSCSLAPGLPKDRANLGLPDAVKAFQILTGKELPPAMASAALAKATRQLDLKAKARVSKKVSQRKASKLASVPRGLPSQRKRSAPVTAGRGAKLG